MGMQQKEKWVTFVVLILVFLPVVLAIVKTVWVHYSITGRLLP